jgi:hypothetical protein
MTPGWLFPRLTVAAAAICGVTACERVPNSMDEVIARHTHAIGGASAIESVSSIEFQLHIIDPGFEADATYRAMRPGRMRIDVVAAGTHVFTEAFNGAVGWQWKGEGKIIEEKPEATAALQHGVELPGKLFGLHELQRRGHQVALVGRESVGEVNYYVLRLTLKDGYSTRLYVDPSSWLIVRRRDFRPLHVDIDPRPTTIESVFSDFREVSGVKFPFSSVDTDLQSGKVLETVRVNRIVTNPPFEEKIFDEL